MDVETMIAIKRQMETQTHMICNRKTVNDIQLSRTKIDHDYRYNDRLDGCVWCDHPESEHTRKFITECCHEMCLECLMEEGRALHDLRICDKKVLAYSKTYYSVIDYIVKHCTHEIIEDTIDIDGDRSRTIYYCRKCELNAGDISSGDDGV